MSLMTQAAYARRHGVSRQAIGRYVRDGILPTHGPRKRIDPAEADGRWVPRIDAGKPQCRAVPRRTNGRPRQQRHHTKYPAADGAWEVLTWRAWVPDAAARLAQALEVQVDQVRPVLGELVEAQLEEFGLYAKDVQDQIAAWLEETGDG
jgi:hypothetical protein